LITTFTDRLLREQQYFSHNLTALTCAFYKNKNSHVALLPKFQPTATNIPRL